MKLCVFSKSWREGAGWYAQGLAQGLAEAGADLVFIAPPASPEEREPNARSILRLRTARERVDGAGRLTRALASLQRIGLGLWALARARRRCRQFIFTTPEPLPITLLAMLALRFCGADITFVVHDPHPHSWALPKPLRFVERALHGFSYRLANRLVSLTQAGRAELIAAFAIAPKRVHVIPHGAFSLPVLTPSPTGQSVLLAFGAIRRNKRLLETIEAVSAFGGDVRLIIAGAPDPRESAYWRACEALIARNPGHFQCEIGFVSEPRLAELTAKADAFVLPYEDFASQSGVAVLAALNGRPVLASAAAAGALFELGMAGVDIAGPISAATITEALHQWRAISPTEWARRCDIARARLEARLAWPRIGQDFLAILQ
jgi:glycogen synthase